MSFCQIDHMQIVPHRGYHRGKWDNRSQKLLTYPAAPSRPDIQRERDYQEHQWEPSPISPLGVSPDRIEVAKDPCLKVWIRGRHDPG